MAKADYYLDISSSDEAQMQAIRTVLTYESNVRGLTLGQTFLHLMRTAARVDEYPEEVKDQLRHIDENIKSCAVKNVVEMQGISQNVSRSA